MMTCCWRPCARCCWLTLPGCGTGGTWCSGRQRRRERNHLRTVRAALVARLRKRVLEDPCERVGQTNLYGCHLPEVGVLSFGQKRETYDPPTEPQRILPRSLKLFTSGVPGPRGTTVMRLRVHRTLHGEGNESPLEIEASEGLKLLKFQVASITGLEPPHQPPVPPPPPITAAEETTQNTTSHFVNPLYDVLGFFRRVEDDEGTVLRRHLAKARHQVNDIILGAKSTVDDSRRTLQSQQQALGFPVSRIEGTISSFRAFARQHTELTLTGVALAVAIPSSIAGRKAMLINSLFAAAGTAAVLELADWYDRRRGGRAA